MFQSAMVPFQEKYQTGFGVLAERIGILSIVGFKSQATQWVRLRAVLDWFRHARVALGLPRQDVDDLSDRALKDIGAERKDIVRAMDRELGRLGLLDIGWQQPRRAIRR